MSDLNVNLSPDAFALRPARIIGEELRYYTATTFPAGPWQGCELYLRRCRAFGYLKDDGRDLIIDVLNEQGDIIQDYPVTRAGFEYLRQQLKFRVDK